MGWRCLDHFIFAILDLLHAPSQRFAEERPTALDLVQAGVAAALGDGGQAIEPLDIVEFLGQCLRRKGPDAHAGPGKKSIDQLDGARSADGGQAIEVTPAEGENAA